MSTTTTGELLRLQTREFYRDRRGFLTSLLLPLGLAGIFYSMAVLLPAPEGGYGLDVYVMPMVTFLAVSTSPLMATAASLAGARERGTLRLLGTTPVGRTRLVLSHVPARLGFVLAQITLLIITGTVLGFAEPSAVPALLGVALLGVALFGSVGYLLGGVLPSAETAWNVSVSVQIVPFFLSGFVLPLALLPDPVQNVLERLPTTFFADLLVGLTPHGDPVHPTWLSVTVVLATTVLLAALAVRFFRWDQGENG